MKEKSQSSQQVFRENTEKLQRANLAPHWEVRQRPPHYKATVESFSRPTQADGCVQAPTVLFRQLSIDKANPTSSRPSSQEFNIWLVSSAENASVAVPRFSLTSAWLRWNRAYFFLLLLLRCLPLIWFLLGRASWTWGLLWTHINA